MEKTVYTVAEIQQMLGVGRGAAYRLCNSNSFPVKRVGRNILVPIKSFMKWLYSTEEETSTPVQTSNNSNEIAS